MDYAGPIQGKMILVVIDAHSKWIEAMQGGGIHHIGESDYIFHPWRTIFSTNGTPQTLVSDNGSVFTRQGFATFMHVTEGHSTYSGSYLPSSHKWIGRAGGTGDKKGLCKREH